MNQLIGYGSTFGYYDGNGCGCGENLWYGNGFLLGDGQYHGNVYVNGCGYGDGRAFLRLHLYAVDYPSCLVIV